MGGDMVHYEVWKFFQVTGRETGMKVLGQFQTLEEAKACLVLYRPILATKDSHLAGTVLAIGIDEVSSSDSRRIAKETKIPPKLPQKKRWRKW
jgi:hypothetical protein